MYFDTTNMDRLIHQMRPRNIGVDRMLDKFVGVAETSFVEKPDGVAAKARPIVAPLVYPYLIRSLQTIEI